MINFGLDDNWHEEPLHPDLEAHVTNRAMGKMVHHPLVIQMISNLNYCSAINKNYLMKKDLLEGAMASRDYKRAMMLHERPYRLGAIEMMLNHELRRNSPIFWEMVGAAWTDSENIYENKAIWEDIWASDPEHREHVMTEEDRIAFGKLRKRFRIYRGWNLYGRREGMSWTTSRPKAIWFAHRFAVEGSDYPGSVATGVIEKKDVLAFFNGRGEREIVVPNLRVIEQIEHCDI